MHYNTANIGIITAIYPTVWELVNCLQVKCLIFIQKKMFLGNVSTRYCHYCHSFVVFLSISISFRTLGFGTALVYQLLSTIAGATNPFKEQKALVFLDYGEI
jgi:hypothetical protein